MKEEQCLWCKTMIPQEDWELGMVCCVRCFKERALSFLS